jgi:hypothetical protein
MRGCRKIETITSSRERSHRISSKPFSSVVQE